MNPSFVRYNARRCAEASDPHCKCACGGAFHGVHHTEAWIQATLKALREKQLERDAEKRKQRELPLGEFEQPLQRR